MTIAIFMTHLKNRNNLTKPIFSLLIVLFMSHLSLGQNVHGIDVSNWQGNINWNNVANDGQVYAWAKASEGMTYQDPQFINNMTNGLNAGVVMGAYHFARPDNNLATEDASNFLSSAGAYIGAGFLPPVLDLENPYSNGQSIVLTDLFTSNELSSWVMEWMNTVETQTGITPIIYVNGNYANYLNSGVINYGLWFAQPDEALTPPVNIGVWDDWLFKQYSWWGEVPGIIGDVDLNIFNGSISEFNELIGVNTADISSNHNEINISFFPNPVIDKFEFYGLSSTLNNVLIANSSGKKKLFAVTNNLVDVAELSEGIYYLYIYEKNSYPIVIRFTKM
ncbi:MAG: glycoside hydrolase family 25 protein [Crocinitomicaceae bacterium]|nr:glycoside hydrolase family 25 protein [Crocinitomicaceae bacterium]